MPGEGSDRARCRQLGAAQMTSDLAIFRSANLLMQQHGENALIEAAMRADKLMGVGQISLL